MISSWLFPQIFLNSETKKSKSCHQGNFKVPPGKRFTEFLHWSQEHLAKIRTRRSTSFFTWWCNFEFFSCHQVNFKVPPGKHCTEFLHCSQQHLDKIRTRRSTSFFTWWRNFDFSLIKKLSNGLIDIQLIVPPNFF